MMVLSPARELHLALVGCGARDACVCLPGFAGGVGVHFRQSEQGWMEVRALLAGGPAQAEVCMCVCVSAPAGWLLFSCATQCDDINHTSRQTQTTNRRRQA